MRTKLKRYARYGHHNTIHLQGVGDVVAIPAGKVQPGDKLMFNFGYTYTVQEITRSPKSSKLFIKATDRAGATWTIEKRPTTLVPAGVDAFIREGGENQ